jgi:pimeloyl-ACP methyl ester carboxylesterase
LTISDLAEEYAVFIRTHFDMVVDVVGTSTGGSIALQLAADHPDLVRRLVLVSSGCRLSQTGRELQARVASALRAGRTREAAALMVFGVAPTGARTILRGVAWLAARRIVAGQLNAADLATTLEAEDGFDLARCDGPITAKTLIIGGDRDRFYGEPLLAETAALISDSQLRLYRGRGHLATVNDRRTRALISGFLRWPDSS